MKFVQALALSSQPFVDQSSLNFDSMKTVEDLSHLQFFSVGHYLVSFARYLCLSRNVVVTRPEKSAVFGPNFGSPFSDLAHRRTRW